MVSLMVAVNNSVLNSKIERWTEVFFIGGVQTCEQR